MVISTSCPLLSTLHPQHHAPKGYQDTWQLSITPCNLKKRARSCRNLSFPADGHQHLLPTAGLYHTLHPYHHSMHKQSQCTGSPTAHRASWLHDKLLTCNGPCPTPCRASWLQGKLLTRNAPGPGEDKKRKDYTFRRQLNEKPSIAQGCPAASPQTGRIGCRAFC